MATTLLSATYRRQDFSEEVYIYMGRRGRKGITLLATWNFSSMQIGASCTGYGRGKDWLGRR